MTPQAQLSDLLVEIFEPEEFRKWLTDRPETRGLRHDLRWSLTWRLLASDAVLALERRGLLDADFFTDLIRARPAAATEARAIAARLGVTGVLAPAPAEEVPPSPARGPARVLHLSDLHARQRDEWDARPLLTRLVQRVRALVAAGQGPDLIAITGDLACSGEAGQYALIQRWLTVELLPAAGLSARDLLIVPGNHDVDRGACQSVTVTALERVLREGGQDPLDEALGDRTQRRLLLARYKSYLRFLKNLGVEHEIAPAWSMLREVRGLQLHLAGLDTALLASQNEVQGRLVLGLREVNRLLPADLDADVVIALAHHPLHWLVQRDQSAVLPPLRARADLLLRGHLHEPDHVHHQTAHHQLLELPAGASYAGHAWPMSFQMIELSAARAVAVAVFTWRPEQDAWVPDRNRYPPDGVGRFGLGRAAP